MLQRKLHFSGPVPTALRAAAAMLLVAAALLLALRLPAEAQTNDRAVGGVTLTSPNPGELAITWDAPSDAPDDYRVTWKKSDGKWHSYKHANTVEGGNAFPTGTSHKVTGLAEGTAYQARVRARYHDGDGNVEQSGPWSETLEMTVAATPPPPPTEEPTAEPTPPAEPTGLSTTPSHNSVMLAWTDPSDDTITGYQVLRGPDADNLAALADDTGNANTSYTDDTVEAEKTYVYTISAKNADGLSPQSDPVSVTTPAAPPAKPTGLLTGASHNSVLLSWDNPDDDTITGYQILRDDDADSLAVLTDDTGSANTSYIDDTVEAETAYAYAIKARNAHGLGPQSDPVSITTPAAPAEPEIALATATGQPRIVGSIQVGATLSVNTSRIEDTDGLTSPTFSYQWIRIDTDSTETNIPTGTSSTYTLTTDDEGKTIKVKVSFTDDANQPEEVESDATRTVAARGGIRLVSNWNLSPNSWVTAYRARQVFTTGDDPNGYTIRRVQISFERGSSTRHTFTAAVYQSAGGSNIGDLVFNLRPPEQLPQGSGNSLRAPPEAKLEPNTSYTLNLHGQESNLRYSGTLSGDEHSETQPGWSIANQVHSNIEGTLSGALNMRVTGWVIANAPHITNVENISTPAIGAGYNTGDVINIGVTFNESVDVTGTPTLELAIGSSTVNAQYQSAESTGTDLVFTYTVLSGDLDREGIQVNQDSLDGTIKRQGTQVDADLLHNRLAPGYGTRVNSGPPIDRITITSKPIFSSYYGPGENINITVEFAAPVTVTGDPEFEFSLGNSGAGRDVLASYNPQLSTGADVVFTYTVLPTDEDSNGIFLRDGETSIRLDADDSIQAADNKDAVFIYREGGTQGSHRVDRRPRVGSVSVTSTPTAGTDTYGVGEIIEFTMTFNQRVEVTGAPLYVFSLGNSGAAVRTTAAYDAARSGARSLVFTYTVVSTDVDNNGIYLYDSGESLSLITGQSIRNIFGDDARIDYGEGRTQSDHKVDGSLTPSNTPAAGLPTISGTYEVGQTLTASTSGITDADGLTTPGWTYQWIRVDTDGTETDISGATRQTYTLVSGDEVLQLRVRVSFTDDGSASETRTSATYPTTTAPTAPRTLALTTSNGTVTLTWTPPTDSGSSVITKYQYRISSDGGSTWSPDFTDVPDQDSDSDQADEQSYTVSSLTLRTEHTFQVRARNATRSGAAASETITPANTLPEGSPTIRGTAEVGQILTVYRSGITDANGLTSPGWTYQWIRVDTDGTETDISGATRQIYTLVSGDEVLQLRVRVTFTDDGGATETLRSDFYPTTKAPTAPDTLTLTNQRGKVTLTWTPPTDPGSSDITKYQHRISSDGGSTWSPDFTDVPDQDSDSDQADERTYTISSLTLGTEHTIEVRAHNATRSGAAARGTVTPATTPGRPRNFKATAGDQQVVLTWDPPSSDGGSPITHYQYRVRDETDSVWLPGFTNGFQTVPDGDADMDLSDERSFTVTGLTNGHEYNFYVRAHTDQGGSGPPGATAVPTAPLQLTIDFVTGDDLINIQEKADGFAITGQAMMIENVAITVVIGASGDLTATTDSGGNWSVAVPENAAYITQGTLTITVNATLSGYEAMEVTRQFIVDLLKPTILVGRVAADTITLTYNESLDATSVPDGGAYTVYVNGSSVPLAATNPVTISDSGVTITLASAVSDTDTVTLDYTVPTGAGATPIKNLFGNLADALTNQDLSGVGVLVTDAADLQTNEDGSTDTFKVKLLSRPSDRVSIALMSSDTGEGNVAPTPLTFTIINWDTEQTVTVTGVDDTDDYEDQTYQITFVVTSTDTDYNDIAVSPVSVVNIDDDQSPDATLSGLTLADTDANTIDLNETFTSSLKTYTVTAPVTAWRVVVTPTANHEAATFEVLDGDGAALTDADTNTAAFDVDVPIGQTVVKVKVTAEDTTTTETYTVTITRVDFLAKNLDGGETATSHLPFSGFTNLFYRFLTGPAQNGYTVTDVTLIVNDATDEPFTAAIYVPRALLAGRFGAGRKVGDLTGSLSTTGEITLHAVTPINLDRNTHYGLGLRLPSGNVRFSGTSYLVVGLDDGTEPSWNYLAIVTFHDNSLTSSTSIANNLRMRINGRSAAGDETLSALTVTNAGGATVPLDPTFAPAVDNYTASAGPDATSVVINPISNRGAAATIEYLDKDDAVLDDADTNDADFDFGLSLGDNIVKVRVTAPNGVDQRVYTVNVERKVDVTVTTDHERIVNKLHVPTFTLTRNGPLDQSIDVTVSLDNVGSGDAISSAPRTGTATFTANSATAEYTPPASWFSGGGSGEIIVSLVVPEHHNSDSVTVTSLDVSTAVTVSFEQDTYQVPEGAGTLNFNLKAVSIDDIPAPNQSFSASLVTQQGTAKLRDDYTPISAIHTFPSDAWTAVDNHHEALGPWTVTILDDSVYESRTDVNEHFLIVVQGTGGLPAVVKIANPTGGGAQVEIIDDETLTITTTLAKTFRECTTSGLTVDQCASADLTTSAETGVTDLNVNEDVARSIWLRVDTGTGTTGKPVTLADNDKFQIVATPDTDRGATEGTDWSINVKEIAANQNAVITVLDDQSPERHESVQFTASLPGDTQVAESTATLRILDDEGPTPPLLDELTITSGGFDFTVKRQTIDTYTATIPGAGTVTVSLIIATLDSSHTYELQDDSNQIITDSDAGTEGDQTSAQLGTNTIFIVVKDGDNQLARYMLNIVVKPVLANTRANATVVMLGDVMRQQRHVVAEGDIPSGGDQNQWARYSVTAGRYYIFEVWGVGKGVNEVGSTLDDPSLRVETMSGTVLGSDNNSGDGKNAHLKFFAVTTQDVILRINDAANPDAGGDYTLLIREERLDGERTDCSDDLDNTTCRFGVGGVNGSTLTAAMDENKNYGRVEGWLSAGDSGDIWRVSINGAGFTDKGTFRIWVVQFPPSQAGALRHPKVQLYDNNDNLLAENDHHLGTRKAKIRYKEIANSGTRTYYVRVTSTDGGAGAYAINYDVYDTP